MKTIKILNSENEPLEYGIEPWAAGGTLEPGGQVLIEHIGDDADEILLIFLGGVAFVEIYSKVRVTKNGIVELDMLP